MKLMAKFKSEEEYDFVMQAIAYTSMTPKQFAAAACVNAAREVQDEVRKILREGQLNDGTSEQVIASTDKPEGEATLSSDTLLEAAEAGTDQHAE